MRLPSAFSLWLYCDYQTEDDLIGPYRVEYHRRKKSRDYVIKHLGVRIRRFGLSNGRTVWKPRRPSEDTLLLLAMAMSGK